jgi:ribosomal protein L40E
MKRAYIADTLVDAQLIANWLKSHHIPCEVFHQNAVGALGELPVTSPEVWIRREPDLNKAKRLIDEIQAQNTGADKICLDCNETNPFSFDICWKCQHPFPVVSN